MLRRLLLAAALVMAAGSAWAQLSEVMSGGVDPFEGGACVSAACTIKKNVLAYYKLEEASGTRVDSVAGTYSMSATNTPGNATGQVGQAVALVAASSQHLDTGAVNLPITGTDWSSAGWYYITADSGTLQAWFVNGTTTADLRYVGTLNIRFRIAGGTNGTVTDGALSATTFHFIVTRFTAANSKMELSVDNGAFATSTATTANPTTGKLFVGCTGSVANFWNGRIDELGFWSRLLTTSEITYLYASGSGRTLYSFNNILLFPDQRFASGWHFPMRKAA